MVLDVDSTLTRDEGIDLLAAAISEDVANTVAADYGLGDAGRN